MSSLGNSRGMVGEGLCQPTSLRSPMAKENEKNMIWPKSMDRRTEQQQRLVVTTIQLRDFMRHTKNAVACVEESTAAIGNSVAYGLAESLAIDKFGVNEIAADGAYGDEERRVAHRPTPAKTFDEAGGEGEKCKVFTTKEPYQRKEALGTVHVRRRRGREIVKFGMLQC